jgi:hypothetical protein
MAGALEHWIPVMFEDPGQILDVARIAEETGFGAPAWTSTSR